MGGGSFEMGLSLVFFLKDTPRLIVWLARLITKALMYLTTVKCEVVLSWGGYAWLPNWFGEPAKSVSVRLLTLRLRCRGMWITCRWLSLYAANH